MLLHFSDWLISDKISDDANRGSCKYNVRLKLECDLGPAQVSIEMRSQPVGGNVWWSFQIFYLYEEMRGLLEAKCNDFEYII